MPTKKLPMIRGRAMRVTRLTACGAPSLGPASKIETAGFVSVSLTSNTQTPEAIEVTNANGDICISDTPVSKFINYGAEIAFCGVDPELVAMLTGQPVVMGGTASADIVGFRQNSRIDVNLIGFALELWTGIAGDACTAGSVDYGYILLPFLKGGTLSDFTVENGAINFTLTGATTRDGAGWGVGPYNVTLGPTGISSPLLTTITVGDHLHVERVSVAPPTPVDTGATAVGVPATSLVAGTPGTSSPANSYAPATLAALIADCLAHHGVDHRSVRADAQRRPGQVVWHRLGRWLILSTRLPLPTPLGGGSRLSTPFQ
jgi:hypothetical protein